MTRVAKVSEVTTVYSDVAVNDLADVAWREPLHGFRVTAVQFVPLVESGRGTGARPPASASGWSRGSGRSLLVATAGVGTVSTSRVTRAWDAVTDASPVVSPSRTEGAMVLGASAPSLWWRRACPLVSAVTAEDILASIAALPGTRRIPLGPPLSGSVMVAGIEVAVTDATPERSMRKIWRERRSGGATPLLLLVDAPGRSGSVLALGVTDGAGPLRTVEAPALADVLKRVSSHPRLDAVRELGAELERLDLAGVPGLKLRQLLTMHTLDVRLRRDPQRWAAANNAMKEVDRGMDWRVVLGALGYELERRRYRGYLARFEGRPVLVVHPKADPAEFSRLDTDGRPPEGMLLNDCSSDGAPYGLLACASRLRLFEAEATVGSSAASYVDLDVSTLQDDDLAFVALLGPDYLAMGGFSALQHEARAFGGALRQRLDQTIRHSVLPTLGRAIGRWARSQGRDLSDEATREELERACLTLVFRVLFILYAESSGYLPMDNAGYHKASVSALVEEATASLDLLSSRSTSLWDRFALLVKAMRTGNPAWGVPAYNGGLFSAVELEGAATLERTELADPDVATALIGMGRDTQSGNGIDYSTLEIGHLGHIYEGLLSLRLSVAASDLRYNQRADLYTLVEPGEAADVEAGDLLWQTHEGGRKGGGVYYTRSELVRHLVRQAVVPAFEAHLQRVRGEVASDPAGAADTLFDFSVLDPACGSAHFLVVVVNELADLVVRFLAEVPLPNVAAALDRLRAGAGSGAAVEDVALLRRLVLKRCVFGADVSPMGAEVAKLSLWLASFVPGLSLAYLGRNVVVGNSLVGVVQPEAVAGERTQGPALWDEALREGLARAGEAARRVAESDDRTPGEVDASHFADQEAQAATEGMRRLFDLWTAEPFGLTGARAEAEVHGFDIVSGGTTPLAEAAATARDRYRFLHWPLAFPRAFGRERPGFDVVVGNPPWDQVMVKSVGFYALFRPGLVSLPEPEREAAISQLLTDRPELQARLDEEQLRTQLERAYFSHGEYEPMRGHPDLYKFFCQRYGNLLRERGALGVVLPRSTFATDGSAGFRRWLFEENACRRVDFLLNRRSWIFDTHPQYTIALAVADRVRPGAGHTVRVAGTATSLAEWEAQADSPGLALTPAGFGPGWTTPLLRSQNEADLLAKLRHGHTFPYGSSGRWRCFAIQELNETFDRPLWQQATGGWSLWKGESFEQYDPHGAEARACPDNEAVRAKVNKPRPGGGSVLAGELSLAQRQQAVHNELGRARVAFRDVTNRTNSRTVLACLVPPRTFLTNKAPYLAFAEGDERDRAACLGIMNSLAFDWQARRFVEINLNFFILEGLVVPDLSGEDYSAVAAAAARLSCVDERFADFAATTGVEAGPLADEERERLRVDIDARVARAWDLSADDLAVALADFTNDAVPYQYRRRLVERLAELREAIST